MKVSEKFHIVKLGRVCIYPDQSQGRIVIETDGFEFYGHPGPTCKQGQLAALEWARKLLKNEIERVALLEGYTELETCVRGNSNEELQKLIAVQA